LVNKLKNRLKDLIKIKPNAEDLSSDNKLKTHAFGLMATLETNNEIPQLCVFRISDRLLNLSISIIDFGFRRPVCHHVIVGLPGPR
jgi:hypothetical protein